jgi:hypothetical protein
MTPSSATLSSDQWQFSAFTGPDARVGSNKDNTKAIVDLKGVLQLALNVMMSFEVLEESANASHTGLLMRQGAHVIALTKLDSQRTSAHRSQHALVGKQIWRALQGFLSQQAKRSVASCPNSFSRYVRAPHGDKHCLFYGVNDSATTGGECGCGVHFGGYVNPLVHHACQLSHQDGPTSRICALLAKALSDSDSDAASIDVDLMEMAAREVQELEASSASLRLLTSLHSLPTIWDLDAVAAVLLKREEQFMYYPSQHLHGKEPQMIKRSDIHRALRSRSVNSGLIRPESNRLPDWQSHQRASIVFDREDSRLYATFSAATNTGDVNWSAFHRVGNLRLALRFLTAGVRLVYFHATTV